MAVETGATPPRTDALTGLRFFAAGWVFLYHAWAARGAPAAIQSIVRSGSAGVPLFFILSGFVLTLNYLRAGHSFDAKGFAVARFARVYPVYLLALMSSLPLFIAYCARYRVGIGTILKSSSAFVLLQNWLLRPRLEILPPTWTLSVEALFYLFCIFAFPRMRRLTYGRNVIIAAIWFAVTVAVTAAAWRANLDVDWEWAPLQLPGFLIGILLGRAYLARGVLKPAPPKVGNTVVTLAILSGLGVVLESPRLGPALTNAALIGPFAVLIFALATTHSLPGNWLSRPTIVFLGGASYAIYLFHYQLNQYGHLLGERLGFRADTSAYAIALSVVVVAISAIVFRYYEEPLRHRVRARLTAR